MRQGANKTAVEGRSRRIDPQNHMSINENQNFATRSNSTSMSKRGGRQFRSTLYVQTSQNRDGNPLEFRKSQESNKSIKSPVSGGLDA